MQAKNIRQSIADVVRHKEEITALTSEERKRRQVSETATIALRSRVNFLTEQAKYIGTFTVTWQEQKTVLKAQINALQTVNATLRKRLLQFQKQFIAHTVSTFTNNTRTTTTNVSPSPSPSPSSPFKLLASADPNTTDSSFMAREAFDKDNNNNNNNNINYNSHYNVDYVPPPTTAASSSSLGATVAVPSTAEAEVERHLFDAVCGFSAGTRTVKENRRGGGGGGDSRGDDGMESNNKEDKNVTMTTMATMKTNTPSSVSYTAATATATMISTGGKHRQTQSHSQSQPVVTESEFDLVRAISKAVFKVEKEADGTIAVTIDEPHSAVVSEMELMGYLSACELYESLKLHPFLKFIQCRGVTDVQKLIQLYTEK
eukprot:gene37433-48962_t